MIKTGQYQCSEQTANFHTCLTKRLYLLPGVDIGGEFTVFLI